MQVFKATALKISEYVDLDYYKQHTDQRYISPYFYSGAGTTINMFLYLSNKTITTVAIIGAWDSSNLWECYIYGIK